MAMNVFGTPITTATLTAMPEFDGKQITRTDRARVALNMKNAKGNDVNARQYVENLGKESESDIITHCLLYNATGGTLKFVEKHDWYGHLSESPLPVTIANGQWAGFVHVAVKGSDSGSHCGVVYRGMDGLGRTHDWMMSWRNAYTKDSANTVYTEICSKNHFGYYKWIGIRDYLDARAGAVYTHVWNGCTSTISTGSGYKAVVEAIFSLEQAEEE